MKFYPDADIWFYVDKTSCMNSYQKHSPKYSWKLNNKSISRVIPYWRDIEGPKMLEVKRKDLYFTNWQKSRIRPQACLGMLYATGQRFIRLAMDGPGGFKCAPLPVNLEQARMIKVALAKKRKRERKAAKKAKKEAKAKAKAKAKGTDKGKGKGATGGTQSKDITYKNVNKLK